MREVILFVLTFIFFDMIYYVFTIRKEVNKIRGKSKGKAQKAKKKKKVDEAKLPVEINYMVLRYRLDMNKIVYWRFLQIMGVVTSFDLALVVTIVSFIESTGLQLVVGLVLLIPILVLSYHFIGLYYRKKGMTLDV